jgi:hypothetical protein
MTDCPSGSDPCHSEPRPPLTVRSEGCVNATGTSLGIHEARSHAGPKPPTCSGELRNPRPHTPTREEPLPNDQETPQIVRRR